MGISVVVRRAVGAVVAQANRFKSDARGNIVIVFAIASLPIISFVGAAIDYSNASSVRSKLQAAQDAAVLSAVSLTGNKMTPQDAQDAAIKFFNAQVSSQGLSATINLRVTDSSAGRTATSNFSSDVTTSFMKVAGYPVMTVTNSATASVAPPAYIDFYMLLDNSPSMGLGATQTDIDALKTKTASKSDGPCGFACHDLSDSNSNYKIAKANSIKLRIDVVAQATQQLTDTAQSTATVPNQFRMGVYTFGSSCTSQGLTTVSTLSSSMSSVKVAASNIDLMTIPNHGFNQDMCTDLDNTFVAMNSAIPAPGPGTAASPQKYVFFVSDGVAGASYATTCSRPLIGSNRCVEPLNPSICSALKARGIKVAVLYTTYLPLPDNGFYNDNVSPFNSQIATNMEACASPGFYFEVSPTEGIANAMDALFKKAVAKARLTS
jgi:Flp pilus assembly protein TadG